MNILVASIFILVDGPIHAKDGNNLRIVTIGSAVSEVVCALDFCDSIVASDVSSLYPESLLKKPRVGYFRKVSPEGVLSVKPDIIMTTDAIEPKSALDIFTSAKVPVIQLPSLKNVANTILTIEKISKYLNVLEKGKRLSDGIQKELQIMGEKIKNIKRKPTVLFIYSRGPGKLHVAGLKTAAAELIVLSGGTPAISEFTGFKPITKEAVIAANPDIILMTDKGYERLGERSISAIPGAPMTKAGSTKSLVKMDDLLLLGFGPRLGKAVNELYAKIHNK